MCVCVSHNACVCVCVCVCQIGVCCVCACVYMSYKAMYMTLCYEITSILHFSSVSGIACVMINQQVNRSHGSFP